MMKKISYLVLLAAAAVLLYHLLPPPQPTSALAEGTPTRTGYPTRTKTQTSTRRPTKTKTPTITRTPSPTSTATPTCTATPAGLFAWVEPSLDLSKLHPAAPFVLHFSYPVDTGSTGGEPVLLTFPWTEGQTTWDDNLTTLTFQPNIPLTPKGQYHIFLNQGLKDINGQGLNGLHEWFFSVGSGPKVTLPGDQVAGTNRRPLSKLTFDRPMNQASVEAALNVQPVSPFELTWQKNELSILSSQVLTPGMQVIYRLDGRATDADGAPLEEDYSWSYRLATFTAQTASISEPGGKKSITISFNYPVEHSSVEKALRFTPTLTSTLTWYQNVLHITPPDPMDTWALYEIHFNGALRDNSNNPLPALEPLHYAPPVPIVLEKDRDTTYLEDVRAALAIQFTIPVDHASVEPAFRIEPVVEGKFTWQDNKLSFQPDQPLAWGTTYTVSILPSAKSETGKNFLAAPYTRNFIARTKLGGVSFGEWGANLQVVDADGKRAIQFQGRDATTLDFALYQFDLLTFIEQYRSYFTIESWYSNNPVIPTANSQPAAAWTWKPEQVDERAVVPEVYLPQEVGTGLYLLEMKRDGSLIDQLFVVITHNTLVVKKSGEELLIWVSDINGESVPDIEVRLYSTRGEKLRVGQADANGVYRTTVPEGYEPLLVVARTPEGDFAISGLEGIWGPYSSYWGIPSQANSQPYLAYIYTDRPIYRPGQTVYYKVIARADRDVKYSLLPVGTAVTVRIHDERDNELQTIQLATNAFGSVNGEFQLTEGAMLGNYTLEVVVEGSSFSQIFKVQDYRKPDIQVSISTDAARYVTGDPVTIRVAASYFFGQPVANARVSVSSYRLEGLNCYWYDCTPGMEQTYLWYSDYSEGVKLSGYTDSSGRYTTQFDAKYDQDYYYSYDEDSWYSSMRARTVGLEVTIDDGSGQTVSSFTVIEVYNAAEKLSLDLDGWLQPPGQPIQVKVADLTIDGDPVAGNQLALELRQWNTEKYSFTTLVTSTLITTDEAGQAVATIIPAQSGYYQLRLSGKDSRGNPILNNRYIYVYEPGDSWANTYTTSALSISADQTETRAYQKAHLIIESTFSGPAMLTFERGRVNRVRPILLTAPLTTLEVEIIPEDAPNIFITVNAWQPVDQYPPEGSNEDNNYWYWEHSQADSILRTASVELMIDTSDKALNVEITPDREIYAPRQSATFTVTVTDAQNRPVVAEVSLTLVDEAIFTLSSELAPSISDAFYGLRDNTVYTYDSMHPYRVILEMGGMGGGGGADGPSSPRSDFPDTAAWYPAVVTDKYGIATISLDLPDNLTSWRIMVRAVTKNTLVGEAYTNILTQQPVVVRPQLPTGLVAGDQVELSAFVHNYSEASLDLVAAIQISDGNLSVSGPLTQSLTLAAGEVRQISWTATALEAGETLMTISAFPSPLFPIPLPLGEIGDAVQLPLLIQPLTAPAFAAQTGAFQDTFDSVIPLPEEALGMSTVRLELSRSAAGELLTGLEYLTGYPYGCVEQTMSRALPNAVVSRAFDELNLGDTERTKTLEPLIRAGLQRLYGYQHNDGGWGWWYDDATNDYQTAWVVFGLALTAEAGYPVEPKVIERGTQWLQKHLDDMDIRTRAYALYSMAVAGYGDLASVEALDTAARLDLDPFSQASLALAYHKLGAMDQARTILELLAASATQRDGRVYWPQRSEDGHYRQKILSSTTRSTALALEAFVQVAPEHNLIPGIVLWLMEQRRPNGWGSTNETSYAILALTDHLLALREHLGTTQVAVEINGRPLLTATLEAQLPLSVFDIPFEQLRAGANHLRIRQVSGTGEIYYRLTQRLYLAEAEVPAAGDIQIKREYLDPKTQKPVQAVIPGQLVLVRLTVILPEDGFYMILEDHLPGGLEALNEKLNNTGHVTIYSDENYEGFYWQDYGYNNKEIRGSRVSFFVTEMDTGQHVFRYLARATRPGKFAALPAEAYAMYDDRVWGRSSSQWILIEVK